MSSRFRAIDRGWRPGRTLSLRDQVARMRFAWPQFQSAIVRATFVSTGYVQPTPLSENYRVRIVYAIGDEPKAYVLNPLVRRRFESEAIPHIYQGPRPCLFRPKNGDWTGAKAIATTIVPWLVTWLFYYEVWHATGEWLGGGEHPALETEEKPSQPSEAAAAS
jgi:hypothetical protein